jgi:putative dimethyl sulfoxide reductase chaperone
MNALEPTILNHHVQLRRLISALLCEPERELLIETRALQRIDEAFAGLGCPNENSASWSVSFEEATQQDLLVEFARLFVGPGRVPAPLYGSLYLEKSRELVGQSTLAVEAFYADEGVGVGKDLKELPDHAAIELEFSAHLLDCATNALYVGDDPAAERLVARHEEFESRFLLPWITSLGERIVAAAELETYRVLGERLQSMTELGSVRGSGQESLGA